MNMKNAHETDIKVLLVEDDQALSEMLTDEVEDAGLTAKVVHTAEDAAPAAVEWLPDLIISDLRLPGADGLALLHKVRLQIPENTPDFLIITAFGTVAKAVECLKAGAEDFLTKPLDLEHLKLSMTRTLEKRKMRHQLNRVKTSVDEESKFYEMYGRSRSMQNLFQQIRQVAKADGPVLIMGESGTGKELVAQAVHAESSAHTRPFLVVNCAGIPEHLLESEFFGHEAGAFTGATDSRQGILAEAEGGTLLLDEISEIPVALQAKLLRMLQDGKIRPVGSNREQEVHVRIIAATNKDIEQQMTTDDFREDLFYRLETFQLHVPPLRERDNDIDLLARTFLARYASAAGKDIEGFSEDAYKILHTYHFPGNVRELQNAIERAVAFCNDRDIRSEYFPDRMRKHPNRAASGQKGPSLPQNMQINDDSLPTLAEVENAYIRHVLAKVDGNKRTAASILGIARRTLYRRIEELDDQTQISRS